MTWETCSVLAGRDHCDIIARNKQNKIMLVKGRPVTISNKTINRRIKFLCSYAFCASRSLVTKDWMILEVLSCIVFTDTWIFFSVMFFDHRKLLLKSIAYISSIYNNSGFMPHFFFYIPVAVAWIGIKLFWMFKNVILESNLLKLIFYITET